MSRPPGPRVTGLFLFWDLTSRRRGYADGVIRKGFILLGLLAFALSTTGAAETLHRLFEHGPAPACETTGKARACGSIGKAPSDRDQPADEPAPEEPAPDHDDCTVCLTLGAARDAADEPSVYEYAETAVPATDDAAPTARAPALPVFVAGPARAPPFCA